MTNELYTNIAKLEADIRVEVCPKNPVVSQYLYHADTDFSCLKLKVTSLVKACKDVNRELKGAALPEVCNFVQEDINILVSKNARGDNLEPVFVTTDLHLKCLKGGGLLCEFDMLRMRLKVIALSLGQDSGELSEDCLISIRPQTPELGPQVVKDLILQRLQAEQIQDEVLRIQKLHEIQINQYKAQIEHVGEEANIVARIEIVEKLRLGFVVLKPEENASAGAAAGTHTASTVKFIAAFFSDIGTVEERAKYFETEEDYAENFYGGGRYYELKLADDYANIIGDTCRGLINW